MWGERAAAVSVSLDSVYIQPRLARHGWGKCGPDTLPFTGRQRLHYANATTRGKEREREGERRRPRREKSEQKRECEEETSGSRKRGRELWCESEGEKPHSLYMRGRTCCHLLHLNAPRSLFSTRHLNWVRQVLENQFKWICKDIETLSERYRTARGRAILQLTSQVGSLRVVWFST